MKNRYFQTIQETWTKERCAKAVKRIGKDGMGTPYGFKGSFPEVKSGKFRYNGGCVRGEGLGEWFEGDEFFLPILAEGYEWQYVHTWCWRIVKK